jgi:CARDB
MRRAWTWGPILTVTLSAGLAAQRPPIKVQPGGRPSLNQPGHRIGVTIVDGIDLIPMAIALDPANRVSYVMVNAGRTAVPQPFVADIYLNGVRRDTYKHAPMAGQAQAPVVSTLARVDSCGTVEIRIVADAQQVITEANEGNNTQTTHLTPKCPDLTVTAIKQDWQDLNTRYRIQITVQNQGNLTTPRTVIARAWGGPEGLLAGLDPGAWPILQDTEINPLPPNGATTFHLSGVYLGTDKVIVKIYLDFFHQIVERRTDNNFGTKQFGPG